MLTYDDIKEFAKQIDPPMLSLYLGVDSAVEENQSALTPGWRTWIKAALKEIEGNLSKGQRILWPTIQEKVNEFLATYIPTSKTVVLINGQHETHAFELPVRLENYAAFGEPALTLLLYAVQYHQPFLLTFVTHNSAQFFIMSFEEIYQQAETELVIPKEEWHELSLMPATSAGGFIKAGSHRDRFADRVDEHTKRFYRDVAGQARKIANAGGMRQVILAGNEEAIHAVHNQLKDDIDVESLTIADYLTPSEIFQKVAPLVLKIRDDKDLQLIQESIETAHAHGRAVLGLDVQKALEHHAVEQIIISLPTTDQQRADKLAYEGLRAGVNVKVVGGDAARSLGEVGGVAAQLYYRPEL